MSRFDVKNFCSPPDPELLCGICMNVLDKPKETPCRHVFCEVCITTALGAQPRCPMCRTTCKVEDLQAVLPLVQNLLNKLPMRCKYYREGKQGISCTETIKKEFYFSHMRKCDYSYINCSNKGCKLLLLRKDKEAHKKTCYHRKISCTKGCHIKFKWKDRGNHDCLKALKKVVKELERENRELKKQMAELALQMKYRAERTSTEGSVSTQLGDFSSYPDNPTHGSVADTTSRRGIGESHVSRSHQEYSAQNRRVSPTIQGRGNILRRSALGMFGFGSDARSGADGVLGSSSQGQGSFYDMIDRYGPPVVDMNERDLHANYGPGGSGLDSNRTSEHQAQNGGAGRPDQTPPIINLTPRAGEDATSNELDEDGDRLEGSGVGSEGGWDEEYQYDYEDYYEEQYDSYGEDVWESQRSWSNEGEEEEEFSRGETDDSNPNSTDNYDHEQNDQNPDNGSAGSSRTNEHDVQGWSAPNDSASRGSSNLHPEEYVPSASGSGTHSSFGHQGQRRPRDYGSEQDSQDSRRKRPRIDTSRMDGQTSTAAISSTVSSTWGTLSISSALHPWRSPPGETAPSDSGERRRSGRLQGITPPPSAIPNVPIPPSTAQLLDQYADDSDDDDDTYESSYDSDDYC